MATRVLQDKCSNHVTRMCEKNQTQASRLTADGAKVLHGYLAERGGDVEEKQVDVLCAVAVADLAERIVVGASQARCIVCISEDMDLMPAYDFAHARGVPVFAAAIDTVHVRPDQKSWILLDEDALNAACPSSVRFRGMKLRSWIARLALADHQDAGIWTVGHATRDGLYEMSRNNGARGFWTNPDRKRGGEKVPLYATGVIASKRTSKFPALSLSDTPPSSRFAGVEVARVKFWVAQNRVKVSMGDGSDVSIWAPTGSLLPGEDVAVLKDADNSINLIGALDRAALPPTWPTGPGRRTLARVTVGRVSVGWAKARLEESGVEVAVALKGVALDTHDRIAVALVGEHPTWGMPAVHPVSSPLPQELVLAISRSRLVYKCALRHDG